MSATSLKLAEALKRRIERLAGAANKTPHAFMVDVLSQEADRAELRERFAADAAVSEKETMERGKAVPLGAAFDYLEAREAGRTARRLRARAWRASK
jgi:predicted transcriptional regulator